LEDEENLPPAQVIERLLHHIEGYSDVLPPLKHYFKDIKTAETKAK
jgi:hypothetical protein